MLNLVTGSFLPTKRTNGISTSELLQRSQSLLSSLLRASEKPVY